MTRIVQRSAVLVAILGAIASHAVAASPDTTGPARAVVGETIDRDTVWEGRIAVNGPVSVKAGVRLTVGPGALVLFADGAGLTVAGTLSARGAPGKPIRFMSAGQSPGRGAWQGITLSGTGEGSVLARCEVTNAEAVRLMAGAHEVAGCAIRNGITGISVGSAASGRITGNTISGMTEAGVECRRQATPVIENNVISDCGKFGVEVQRHAGPIVANNAISGCDVGITYSSPAPSPEGNRLENNRIGIGLSDVGAGMSVSRSRFIGNGTGLWAQHFSSPRVEGNVFDNNAVGIFCFRSSSPRIAHNRIVRNRQGVVCQQLSEPRVVANELAGNGTGMFLTLSSYAVVNGNNFDNNAVQIELGIMSHDWEVKIGGKPVRGESARRTGKGQRWGIPPGGNDPASNAAVGLGVVDATGNWWGDRDTAEMNAKGADAAIGSLIDGRDVVPQKSEGYEGEFARDRIDYSGWKTNRIPDAGVPGS